MNNNITHKIRVLIVDDEPEIGEIFGLKLKQKGYDVIVATRGAEAIEIIKRSNLDIVLLDILMPEITGFDVLDQVRQFSQVPIIVFSASSNMINQMLEFGANDFITKPCDLDCLVRKIEMVLDSAIIGNGKSKFVDGLEQAKLPVPASF